MKYSFSLYGDEKTLLEYLVTQALYQFESKLDEFKFIFPDNTDLIERYNDILLELECIHSHLFEGGDD